MITTICILYLTILFIKMSLSFFSIYRFKQNWTTITPINSDYTIIQPILSGDLKLSTILELNIREHPDAHFLWLIDEDDPIGIEIVQRIRSKYPTQKIKIIICPICPDRINPKLFKFQYARTYIPNSKIIFLDDDTYLPRQTAVHLINGLENYTLITGLPCYLDNGSVLSKLLAQFVNNNSAMTYLPLLSFLPPISINGMCYSLKLDTIDKIQNFQPILHHLTDDLALATILKKSKFTISQIPSIQYIQTTVNGFSHYFRLMHRWFLFAILLLKNESIFMKLLILLLQGISPFLFWILFFYTIIDLSIILFVQFLIVLLIRFIVIGGLQVHLTKKLRHDFLLSIVSELLQPFHLLHAVFVRTIVWRKRKYFVYDNDRFF